MAKKKKKLNKILCDKAIILTDKEELEMSIEFTKDHIEEIKIGDEVIKVDGLIFSKTMYLEGAYKHLKEQEILLKKLNSTNIKKCG